MMRHLDIKVMITVVALIVLGVACQGFAIITDSQASRKIGVGLVVAGVLLSIIPLLIAAIYLFIRKILNFLK